jgi:hypothetical protein
MRGLAERTALVGCYAAASDFREPVPTGQLDEEHVLPPCQPVDRGQHNHSYCPYYHCYYRLNLLLFLLLLLLLLLLLQLRYCY